jgi:hypothetical protein
MFLAYAYLAMQPTERAADGGQRGPRPGQRKGARRATRERVTEEQLDQMGKALALRLDNLVDRLAEEA